MALLAIFVAGLAGASIDTDRPEPRTTRNVFENGFESKAFLEPMLAVSGAEANVNAINNHMMSAVAEKRSGDMQEYESIESSWKSNRAASASNGYAPYDVSCPAGPLVRPALGLNSGEAAWLRDHDSVTQERLVNWLEQSDLRDFNPRSFLESAKQPTRIGLAFSGGGFRAMLTGAGSIAALDGRTEGSANKGHLGGLLQASTYLSGLSGGAWLVGSLAANGWMSVQQALATKGMWEFENPFVPYQANVLQQAEWWAEVVLDILSKARMGFNTSMTDIWSRALSAELFMNPEVARTARWSDIRSYDAFTSHDMPLPILIADERLPGQRIISLNSTVLEFSPFEIGSWDPTMYSFVETQYIGSRLFNGMPTTYNCVDGYDNVAFLLGTSSSIFNQILNLVHFGNGPIYSLEHELERILGLENQDIALIGPNPFFGSSLVSRALANSQSLSLVDGGEDGQNVPLHPLIQGDRGIDIILAFDNSADTPPSSPDGANWPNGSSLIATYNRQFHSSGNGTAFPYVPDQNTFVELGYTSEPVFFGCDRSNLTSLMRPGSDDYPPVVVYMANSPHSYLSNTSTFKVSYNESETAGLIKNGYNLATQNNGTTDESWRTCLSCAIVLREQQRQGVEPTPQCKACLSRYCWDGTVISSSQSRMERSRRSSTVPGVKLEPINDPGPWQPDIQ